MHANFFLGGNSMSDEDALREDSAFKLETNRVAARCLCVQVLTNARFAMAVG